MQLGKGKQQKATNVRLTFCVKVNYSFKCGINFDDILIDIYAEYTFGGGFCFFVLDIFSRLNLISMKL